MSLQPRSQPGGRYTRIRVHNEGDFNKLYPLILDYIRDPELAFCVKEFVFRSYWPRYGSPSSKGRRPSVWADEENARDISQEHAISQLVTGLGIEEPEKCEWIRALTWMKPELIAARGQHSEKAQIFYAHRNMVFSHYAAALLLIICPNIEILKYEEGSRVVESVLRRNNYGLLPGAHLQKLRDVTILPTSDDILGDERFYTNVDIMAMLRLFHRLPAIESMSIDAALSENDGGYVQRFPPGTSNLKRVSITHSIYGTDVIGPLIKVPKRLEKFTFTTGGRCNYDGGYTARCAETIGRALYEHRSSLRKIDIDIDEYIGGEETEEEGQNGKDEWYHRDMEISTGPPATNRAPNTREYGKTIGSMHDFEALTHLSIGIGLLLGVNERGEAPFRLVDALPKSLEYLLIRGYERGAVARYDAQIDELLLLRQDRLPSLKELHGLDETIPIAVSIEDPDDNEEGLWRPDIWDDEWVEVLS
ncbi:hypothetical protein NUW58_g334 [Xylaria curta]|uniref:Uncharacterized protein n=1 Tax=Xylaria curta TaxID=42375 RepID=A0ACC1PRE3_9PEZI|nr:hypothetical protein NUW58_g334 [Xylaria curta]